MIKNLSKTNENLAVFEVSGSISKEDYERVIFPVLEELHAQNDKLNMVYIMDAKISDYSFGAMWEDALVGMKYFSKWHRVALVSDNSNLNKTVDFLSKLLPGKFKGFAKSDQEEAIHWAKRQD